MSDQAGALVRCLDAGGVALFGADTVYGLACDPTNPDAVERMLALKGRPAGKPAAIAYFELEHGARRRCRSSASAPARRSARSCPAR